MLGGTGLTRAFSPRRTTVQVAVEEASREHSIYSDSDPGSTTNASSVSVRLYDEGEFFNREELGEKLSAPKKKRKCGRKSKNKKKARDILTTSTDRPKPPLPFENDAGEDAPPLDLSGPLFDAFGPRYLVLVGSILMLLTYILLAWCTQYWHFIVCFSCLGGTGTALVFTPSIAAIGHWFYLRRGTFTGVACVGGSLGGIIFPLTLQALFGMENIGWAWSQRILALINLPLAICANLFIRSRLPPTRPVRKEQILPDPRIFRDKTFALVTLAVFFVEWGLFVPISYLTNFALAIGVDETFSYQIIAIFNAGSCFGRWLPGLVADKVGRFNTMILTTVICWIGTFAFWLPSEMLAGAGQTARLALLIVFSLIFGFGSGAGISLVPVCVGQLCKTEEYGRYYATCYTIVSFATLTGIPLAGGLLVNENGRERYWGLILFTGMSYLVSTAVFIGAKMTRVGFGKDLWKGRF
ncbi:hypothetical protein LTS08_008008 [Lithohypha guttulata]|nr:hypothetical protein LTS08_008008 [Lithohypha guttulata]